MEQKGLPLRRTKYKREYEIGVSLLNTVEASEAMMRAYHFVQGRYIVPIDIPDDDRFEVRQTTDNPNHYTVYQTDYVTRELLATLVGEPITYVQ